MLLDLPVEILSEVLVLLDHLSILRCSALKFPLPHFSFSPSSLFGCHVNRSAGSSMSSSLRLSISNTASSSQQRGSLMGRPEVQR